MPEGQETPVQTETLDPIISRVATKTETKHKEVSDNNTLETAISRAVSESKEMRALSDLYPQASLAKVEYKFGWDYDKPPTYYDPVSKTIRMALDIQEVENEMKYTRRDDVQALGTRAEVASNLEELLRVNINLPNSLKTKLEKNLLQLKGKIPNSEDDTFGTFSFLEFDPIKDSLRQYIQDEEMEQYLLRSIYDGPLANSEFGLSLLTKDVIDLEVHERAHYAMAQLYPPYTISNQAKEEIGGLVASFKRDKMPGIISYPAVYDNLKGKYLTVDEIIILNKDLMATLSSESRVLDPNEFQKGTVRNARDEIAANVLQHITRETPPELKPIEIFKYATSSAHTFAEDPNHAISRIHSAVRNATSIVDKRQVIDDYFRQAA